MSFQPTIVSAGPISAPRKGTTAMTPLQGMVNKYFYFSMSLLFAAIVVWGFSHTVNDNLLHPAVPRPLMLWFHAAAFSAWVVFYIFQSTLVRTHNVQWHRFFGYFGAALGTAMVVLGFATAVIMGRFDIYQKHEPGADAFLIVPFYDMAAFAVFLALAIFWRKRPELHRRLLFIATCGLMDAAFGRIGYVFNHSLFFACLDLVILLGMARDLFVNGRVHKVYLTALPVLMVIQFFVVHIWRSGSAWWLTIAHAMLG